MKHLRPQPGGSALGPDVSCCDPCRKKDIQGGEGHRRATVTVPEPRGGVTHVFTASLAPGSQRGASVGSLNPGALRVKVALSQLTSSSPFSCPQASGRQSLAGGVSSIIVSVRPVGEGCRAVSATWKWKRCRSRRCRLFLSDQNLVSECRGFTSLLFLYLWSIRIASLVRKQLTETSDQE